MTTNTITADSVSKRSAHSILSAPTEIQSNSAKGAGPVLAKATS